MTGTQRRSPTITVVLGDITTYRDVDATVNAANAALSGGGGVDGAIHAAAGPEHVKATRAKAPGPPGHAVITPAFDLAPVTWVIHAVGPVYLGPEDAVVLASTYTACLARADEVGARSLAFPAISTGVYGYPPADAARVSVAALRSSDTQVERILLVAYGRDTARHWQHALDQVPA